MTRKKLPDRRKSVTQKVHIDGEKLYITTGNYEDGTLGEIFVTTCLKKGKNKGGITQLQKLDEDDTPYSSLMNCFAIAVSLGLQYGVPLDEFVSAFTFTRFRPGGVVSGHKFIKMAMSPIDFIFRHVAIEYLKRYELAQVHPLKKSSAQ